MIWFATEKQKCKEEVHKHAGGKARDDVETILLNCGFKELPIITSCQEERVMAGFLKKIFYHFKIAKKMKNQIKRLAENDAIIFQFPLINHTLLFGGILRFARKNRIRVYALVHDLNLIRISGMPQVSYLTELRVRIEELNQLKLFDGIIVHNSKMKQYLHDNFGIQSEKMVELSIFDYLIDDSFVPTDNIDDYKSCIIAGNLMRQKATYVYSLPAAPSFELYGINFESICAENVHYHGSYTANDLPYHLVGGFGLVWDGKSSSTCCGAYGEYLKYNNPHKTSLYLACGIPVIIWEGAALASFVNDNQIGFTIKSLDEIDVKLKKMSRDDYLIYKNNAINISSYLRSGTYTVNAINKLNIK